MSVAKIFKILIIIVACVIVGALVLNVLLPNTTTSVVNAVEGQIFNATGMTFDLNGDGTTGKQAATSARTGGEIKSAGDKVQNTTKTQEQSGKVNGFK